MKTLFLFLILSFGLSSVLNTANAQKINLECNATLPSDSWKVVSDPQTGEINISEVKLKIVNLAEGDKISNPEEQTKTGLNNCVLEYFLKNPELIPSSWGDGPVVFTGTLFKDVTGSIFFRNLVKREGVWKPEMTYPDYTMKVILIERSK